LQKITHGRTVRIMHMNCPLSRRVQTDYRKIHKDHNYLYSDEI